jgi:molybdopterin converting factor subunit 1
MRILFFAQLREVTGAAEAELEADGVDAVALWELLVARWPGLMVHRAQTRLARNGVYAGVNEVFAEGDEVALIPPVSGG